MTKPAHRIASDDDTTQAPPPAPATKLVRLKHAPNGTVMNRQFNGIGDFKSGVWTEVPAEVAEKLATKRLHFESPFNERTNPYVFDVVATREEAEALDHDPEAAKQAEVAAKLGTAAVPVKLTPRPMVDPVAEAEARAERAAAAARAALEDLERARRR